MRNIFFYISFIAMVAASSLLISCKDDDNACPEEKPSHVDGFNPDLDGIWLTTSIGVEGVYNNPVEIENAGFFIGEPENNLSFLFVNDDKILAEFGLFADADNLVLIESELLSSIEAELKGKGKEIDYMNLSVPAGNEQIYAKMHYELVNKDSLVFKWDNGMTGTNFTAFTRLKEVENLIKEKNTTRGLNIIENKVIPTIGYIQDMIETKIPTKPDNFDALSISMDDLNNQRTGAWSYEKWLTHLPGYIKINEISIPGAHDACTAGIGLIGRSVNADCQTKTLKEQLQAGVRFFDIRTRVNSLIESENDLGTYHGEFRCDDSFESVMSTMKEFLDNNQGEFVILKVAYENKIVGTDYKTESANFYHKVEHKYQDMILPFYPGQPLDSVRGKILVINLQKPSNDNLLIGAYMANDGENNANKNVSLYKFRYEDKDDHSVLVSDTAKMWVQNFYEIGYFTDRDRIDKKTSAIYDFAYSALNEPEIPVFNTQLNANTGNPISLNCASYASTFNAYAFQMLWDNMHNIDYPCLKGGIYSMDYAGSSMHFGRTITTVYGDKLVWAIIELNYRNYYIEEFD